MISFKWKLYGIVNYLLLVLSVVYIIAMVLVAFSSGKDVDFVIAFISICTGFLVLFFNSFVNIYIIRRFFPDKILTPHASLLNLIALVAGLLITAALSLITFFGFREEFILKTETDDNIGRITVLVLGFTILLQYYSLLMQFQVNAFLKDNHHNSIDRLLESIGKSE